MDFGRENGSKLATKSKKIDAKFERPFFEKTLFFLRKNIDFEGSKGCKIEENSIKNQVKSEGQDGMPLGIDS